MQQLSDRLQNDVINDVLTSLRVRSTVYCRSELRAPWGFAIQARPIAAFHLVIGGSGWLEVDGIDDPVEVGAGDLILLMTGRAHRMRDDPSSPVEWLDDILGNTPVEHAHMTYGGPGPATELICGGFSLEGAQANPVLLAMPPLLRIERIDGPAGRWMDALLGLLQAEVAEHRPGAETILARLADILLTQAIRTYLVSLAGSDEHHVAAMRDPRIAKAIRLVHDAPAENWTVEDLAGEVAMSRSAFASRFRQLTGEAPMRYVTRCRLAQAASDLAHGNGTVAEVARRAGYESEASFSRAFSRTFGVSPGAYRKRMRQPSLDTPVGALPEMSGNGSKD